MSAWVLVIVFGWPNTSMGLSAVAVDMPNEKACKAAATEMLPRPTVRDLFCIEREK